MRNEQKKNIRSLKDIILSYLEKISRFEKGMKLKDNAEPLHQLRVYCRRLLTGLWIVGDFLPAKKVREWEKKIKKFAKVLGNARDLDVGINLLKDYAAVCGKDKTGKQGIEKIIRGLKKRRALLDFEIKSSLRKIRKKKTFAKIKKFLSDADMHKDKKISALAGRKITEELNALFRMERWVYKPQRLDKLHKIRLAAKHLRYTLENFVFLHGRKMKGFTESVHAVQDALGKVHDFDVWIKEFHELQEKGDPQLRCAAGLLAQRYRKLRVEYYEDFVGAWQNMKKKNLESFVNDVEIFV